MHSRRALCIHRCFKKLQAEKSSIPVGSEVAALQILIFIFFVILKKCNLSCNLSLNCRHDELGDRSRALRACRTVGSVCGEEHS